MSGRAFAILFIAPLEADAAVAVSGLIPRLAEEIPDPEFTIVTSPAAAPLFADVPGLVRTLTVERYDGFFRRLSLWWKLRGRRYGLIADLGGAGVSRSLRRRRRAERPRGPWRDQRTEAAARVLGVEGDTPAPFIYTNPELEERAELAIGGEDPVLAVGPGAEWIGRTWPDERYGQVANQLMVAPRAPLSKARIVAFGSERDRDAMITATFPLPRKRIIQRPYAQDLLTDFAWLKRCRLYVGGDNVWTHLAAAAGVPTVALYGPSDDEVVRPWGDHVRVVRGGRDFETLRKIDPGFNQQISLMTDLTVDSVLTACRGQLLKFKEPND